MRLMTYNIKTRSDDRSEYGWRNRRVAVASTIRFHRPDLLGCQEVCYDQLRYLRDELPEYEWVGSGRVDGQKRGEFCPIGFRRERFDLDNVQTFWLSENPDRQGSVGWDGAYPRIATLATLRDTESGTMILHANTHLDNEGTKAREKATRLLGERLHSIASDRRLLLTGDFNSTTASTPYRLLTDADTLPHFFDTRTLSIHAHHGPETTRTDFQTLVPDRTIDHMFVTSDWEVIQHATGSDLDARGRFPSDHLPVIVDASPI